jgi:D-alanyl-D-alanine carboxypeptidase
MPSDAPVIATPEAATPAPAEPTVAPVTPTPTQAVASASPPPLASTLGARLQATLDAAVADGFIPGVTLSVRLPDGSDWTGASGMADREAGLAMQPETRVPIGSLSKLFTAVVVLQLVEEGRISLDDPIAAHLPGLLPAGEAITIRMLLQHTSGVYDYLEDRRFVARAYANPSQVWAPTELVAYANEFPQRFVPGTPGGWDYSSTNYVVLGLLIEQVTGNQLAAELDRRIFTPLGLEQTFSTPPDRVDGPQARGYSRDIAQPALSLSFAFGTANIVTTVADMQRFGAALFGGELLAPELLAEMQRFVDGKGRYAMPELQYGLGLMANQLQLGPGPDGQARSLEDGYVLGHIGGVNGFRAAIWYAPERDLLLVVGMNQGSTDPNELASRVLETLLDAP